VNRREFLAAPLALAACAAPAPRGEAGPDGWAGAERNHIVDALQAEHQVDVRSRADLDAALALGERPKLLRVHGRIDLSQGRGAADFVDPAFDFDAYCRAYAPQAWGRRALSGPLEEARKRSASRQATAVVVRIPPRTAIVGATPDAGFADGALMVERTHDVALRNLSFDGVRDHFPAWDPLDGREGEWNSEYDAISLRQRRRVWVDHCSFKSLHPARERSLRADLRDQRRPAGHHARERPGDRVVVRFSAHDKTMLIGGATATRADEGHLRVTLAPQPVGGLRRAHAAGAIRPSARRRTTCSCATTRRASATRSGSGAAAAS
jgi:pectate lyase